MKKILSLVLALCMALCMVSFASAEEVPTLKIITLGNGQPDNYSAWIEHQSLHRREDRRQTGCGMHRLGRLGQPPQRHHQL